VLAMLSRARSMLVMGSMAEMVEGASAVFIASHSSRYLQTPQWPRRLSTTGAKEYSSLFCPYLPRRKPGAREPNGDAREG
jgi:hypothetical protein